MDKERERSRTLAIYLDHLRRLPFARKVRVVAPQPADTSSVDLEIEIETPERTFRLRLDEKRSHLAEKSAAALAAPTSFPSGSFRSWLIAAPAISRATGERLVEHGWNYVDRAGNCHLDLDHRYVARIEGRTAGDVDFGPKTGRALRSASYRVLFALLVDPGALHRPLREVAARAGDVSAQTVRDLREELVTRGLVESTGTKFQWNPARRGDAIDLFVHGYQSGVRERLIVGRYRAKPGTPADVEHAIASRIGSGRRWAFGGGAAAMRYVPYFRGDLTIVHVEDPPEGLAAQLGLIPDRRAGNVILQSAIGRSAFEITVPDAVHPLLAYADLYVEADDRSREAALLLRSRILESDPR